MQNCLTIFQPKIDRKVWRINSAWKILFQVSTALFNGIQLKLFTGNKNEENLLQCPYREWLQFVMFEVKEVIPKY